MRIRCRVAVLAMLFAAAMLAAPPLTTIQDVLYKADGTPFNGVAFIEWKSFQASDFSNIATHSVTTAIINGVIQLQLVPTTNASVGAYYSVRYRSDGRIQFGEIWAVPPSGAPLKLKDVRAAVISTGGQVLPPATETEILESDVVGLVDDLAARPLMGPGYAPGRAAYIGETGALEAVAGSLTDCVRVDGTAGPCGATGGEQAFVDGEVPAGLVDGANTVFTLSEAPVPAASLQFFRNGVLQQQGLDYTLSGYVITFAGDSVPQTGDILLGSYRVASVAAPPGTLPEGLPEVLCSNTGTSTNSTTLVLLGSCTIPGGVLQAGDRVAISFNYTRTGSSGTVAFDVLWGGTTIVARTGGASTSNVAGDAEAGVHSGGAQLSVQSWGNSLSVSADTGSSADSLAAPLVIGFWGRMTSSTSNTIDLRNFTVVRYPARVGP
jgi:hypothetical protein